MILRLALPALLALLAPALVAAQPPRCEATVTRADGPEIVSFDFCTFNVDGTGFQIFYSLDVENDMFKALVRKELPGQKQGWLGLGVTPNPGRMVGGAAAVGMMDLVDGEVIIKDFHLIQKNGGDLENTVLPHDEENQLSAYQHINIDRATYFFEDGINNFYYERPLKGNPDFDFVLDINPTGQTDMVMACGDMETGDGDPTGKTVKGFGHFLERRAVKAFLAEGAFVHQKNEYVAAHGALMGISWGVLVPLSFLIARYSKNECHPMWFFLHRGLNTIALTMMLIGWVLGVFYFGSGRYPDHLGIGTVAVILALFQPLNAYFRPKKTHGDASSKRRHYWEMCHFWVGRVAWILGIVNMALGFTLFGVDLLWTLMLWIGVGVIVLPIIFLEIRGYQKIRPIKIAQEKLSVADVPDSEVKPLVFRDKTVSHQFAGDDLETMRLDIVEDPQYKEPSHKESMRNDLLTIADGKVRRWSYIR